MLNRNTAPETPREPPVPKLPEPLQEVARLLGGLLAREWLRRQGSENVFPQGPTGDDALSGDDVL
jgi:hypothetical protein